MEEWRKRLADRMDDLGMTAAQLTRTAKVGPTMIHDILNRGAVPSIQNLAKIAKALGTTIAFLYEGEQRYGALSITVFGVNRGGDMFIPLSGTKGATVPLDFINENTVFVKIESKTFEPKYLPGDIIGGPKFAGTAIDNLTGQEAIVCTEDNAQYIRFLLRGTKPNRYNLRSFDPRVSDVCDAKIAWVAPIKLIFRT